MPLLLQGNDLGLVTLAFLSGEMTRYARRCKDPAASSWDWLRGARQHCLRRALYFPTAHNPRPAGRADQPTADDVT